MSVIECDDGWFNIVSNMCSELSNIQGCFFQQIKESHGRLVTQLIGPDKAQCIADRYRELSTRICRLCGSDGEICHRGIQYQTLCYNHMIENKFKKGVDITATCNGCFDGLTSGHMFFLGYVKGQTQRLVVGINSDRYMIDVKGVEPMYTQEERKSGLLNLEIVDEVHTFDESNPIEFIKKVVPDMHFTGAEYIETCAEKQACDDLHISLKFVPRVGKWSSTKLREERKNEDRQV